MGRYLAITTRKPRGFTLIELLVVVAIISLLSAIVLAAVNSARGMAYDSKRFTDLREVQTAIENYYADTGSYPPTPSGQSQSACTGFHTQVSQNLVVPSIVPNYIAAIPQGPQVQLTNKVDCYVYVSNGTDYKFLDWNPTGGSPPGATPSGTLNDPARSGVAWAVYSAGGIPF
jgi:prepilin-type N-terminal cleavage/methylation domain-containing protein